MANPMNLDDLKKKGVTKDPFPAPEGYFDSLSDRIQARITEEEEASQVPSAKTIGLASRWYYAAAAVAALVISVWLINPFKTTSDSVAANEGPAEEKVQTLLAEVSNEDLIDYLQMNQVDIYTSVSLTETEEEELLETELESYELPEEYYPDMEYIEDYL
uniref:Uncharacterized protein n=1 Tax=Roseihalotalea indica TaxID=2867963 RepID=A0AA49JJJ5_9BACT|nr:hypothetical protein K4G66_14095 [Tunicatimonas sp. TK19036]